MAIIRSIARPLLAGVFVYGGIDALRHPEAKAPAADTVVSGLVEKIDQLASTEQVVKIDAGVKIVAGSMLALGKFPRVAALALAGSLVPTTVAGHPFWAEKDPAKKAQQRLHFLKNASMLGGVMLAAVDTEGKPSVAWRLRRAPKAVKRTMSDVRRDSELALRHASGTVTGAVHDASDAVTGAARDATGAVKEILPG